MLQEELRLCRTRVKLRVTSREPCIEHCHCLMHRLFVFFRFVSFVSFRCRVADKQHTQATTTTMKVFAAQARAEQSRAAATIASIQRIWTNLYLLCIAQIQHKHNNNRKKYLKYAHKRINCVAYRLISGRGRGGAGAAATAKQRYQAY